MRVAVTGGTGFIGSHVVDRLLEEGHDVVVVDRRPPHRGDAAFVAADIEDLNEMVLAIHGCDAVFHLAAVANVNDAFDHPVDTVRTNMLGTATVWEAARRNDVQRAVLASTVWVYAGARGEGPLDEESPFDLASTGHLYTSSKLASEMIVHSYAELYGVPFTILRYGIPFGPRMRDELVIARFVQKALDGETITIHGDGSQYRSYVYVRDLADAHVLALGPKGENGVFNLEGREAISVRRITESIQRALGRPIAVEFMAARPGDYAGRPVSADKADRVLGWAPTTSFDEGVRRYLDWYLATRPAGERDADAPGA
ncbi:MAG TPA: NAD-dependent epimerase/dehydratase family protein [Acidimicrobiales bacterium]|nr:NAD-dependent epimerase/dehydratase family protein [Acidimicrobiales bacterium]